MGQSKPFKVFNCTLIQLVVFRSIKKQGPLKKRGEFIQNWRDRYFILYTDGTFNGYRREPRQNDANPENNFSVNSKSNKSSCGRDSRAFKFPVS